MFLPRRFAKPAIACLMVLLALLVVGNTLLTTLSAYNAVPIWDDWAMVAHLQRFYAGLYRLPMLWEQHNEHRIATVRLILFADFLVFRGLGLLPVALNILTPIAVGVWLFRLAGAARPFARWEGWVMGGAITVLLASSQQVGSFAEPFDIANMGLGLAVLATVALTIRGRTGWAVVAGLAASGLLASGLLVWPISLVLMLRLGQGRGRTALAAAVGVAVIVLYVNSYTRPADSGDPTHVVRDPLHAFAYFCLYLGNILGKLGQPAAGLFGFAGGAFSAWMVVRLLLRPASLSHPQQILVGFLAFFIGAALLTTVGRSDATLLQAFSARYSTATLNFWAGLACLVWTMGPFGRVPRSLLAVAATLFLFAVLAPQEKLGKIVRRERETKDMAALAATVGVADPELVPVLGPAAAGIFPYVGVLREHRLAMFATARGALLGQTIGRDLPLIPLDRCHGGIDSTLPVADGLRLEGWAVTADRPRAPQVVVIADDSGKIVGLAHPAIGQHTPPRRQDGGTVRPLDWRGYSAADGTTAYAVLNSPARGACLLGRLKPPAS